MNQRSFSKWGQHVTFVAILIAIEVSFSGCHSATYMKADTTAAALQHAGNEIRAEVGMLESVTNTLNDLVVNPTGDLRIQFGRFTDAFSHLESTVKHATARSHALRKEGDAYFAAWDRQLTTVTDEQIHQASSNRKLETVKLFDATMQRYDENQNSLNPLLSYLRDIRIALGADLTMAGLQSARTPAANATQQCAKARENLTRLMADLDALGTKMCFFAQPAVK